MALGTFKIDDSQWDGFKAKAHEDGTNASALLKTFIDGYLSGRLDISLVKGLDMNKPLDSGIEQRLVESVTAELRSNIASLEAKVDGIDERLGKLRA